MILNSALLLMLTLLYWYFHIKTFSEYFFHHCWSSLPLWNTVREVVSVYQWRLNLIWLPVWCLILYRLVYWVSLNVCSSWRGFGSGLTVFPLLAMVTLNLFLMYTLHLKEPLFVSQDVLYNQVTPSSWSGETSQSPSGKPDILPTDILVAQWGGELRFLLPEEEICSQNRPFLWSAVQHSNTRCHHYNLQVWWLNLCFCSSYTGLFFYVDSCLLSEMQELSPR